MSKRLLLPVLALVVVVAALAVGAAAWLRVDDPPRSADPGTESPPATEPGPEVADVPERVHRLLQHEAPWPFAEFAEDIAELRRPKRNEVFMRRGAIEDELSRSFTAHHLTLRLENTTVEGVVAELTREFAALGLRVYTRDPPVDNDPLFERFYMSDVNVWEVIRAMDVRTNGLVTYAVTPEGLCIGSKYACIDARAAATKWEEEQVGEGDPDEDFAFLEGAKYRPDFREAHVGAVVRDVREQTGIEVVVGPDVWNAPVKLTWTADPMPVLAALRQIAIKCGAALYAKDDRVFLLAR